MSELESITERHRVFTAIIRAHRRQRRALRVEAEAVATAAAAAERAARKRERDAKADAKAARVVPRVPVTVMPIEDGEAVAVTLTGKNAAGRSVLLDAADWERIGERHGERWQVLKTGPREYVGRPGGLTLGRLVAALVAEDAEQQSGARLGNVHYPRGPFDVRRASLRMPGARSALDDDWLMDEAVSDAA